MGKLSTNAREVSKHSIIFFISHCTEITKIKGKKTVIGSFRRFDNVLKSLFELM